MKDLPKRAVTAIVFAAVMLAGIAFNEYLFLALLFVIHSGCAWEYYSLVTPFQDYREKQKSAMRIIHVALLTLIAYALATSFHFYFLLSNISYLLVAPLVMVFFVIEIFAKTSSPLKNIALSILPVFYISIPLSMLVFFPMVNENASWFPERCAIVLGLVLLIWTHDTMAYFAGSLFGKHKMLPEVSPKKTWEGFFGGLAFSLGVATLLWRYLHSMELADWLVVGAIVSIFGTCGDLIESMMKRNAGVKDSGTILPGHGGFLDRFDALLFCIPFVFMYYLIRISI